MFEESYARRVCIIKPLANLEETKPDCTRHC